MAAASQADEPEPTALQRLRTLVGDGQLVSVTDAPSDRQDAYLDVLGSQPAPPTPGLAPLLMRTTLVPAVYERYWRPLLGRLLKGPGGPSMDEERQLAIELLDLQPGAVALDVACGTGAFTREFAQAVGPDGLAIGLDASVPMLRQAVRATPVELPVAFLRADAVRPPLPDGSIDAVCCFAALHMFDEPQAALDAFTRLLRPGGRIALLTSGRRRGEPWRSMDTVGGVLSGQRMFDRGEIADALRERGYSDVSERYTGIAAFVAGRR